MDKENWLFKGIIIAIISAIAAFLAQHYGEFIMSNIGNLIKSFLITFSPLIIGLLVFFLYWIIVDYVKLRRFNNKLEKWIGYFAYPDSKGDYLYTDLKGKIKRYIAEELEEESRNRVAADTEITKRLSNLNSEIEDIRTTVPRRAITNKIR